MKRFCAYVLVLVGISIATQSHAAVILTTDAGIDTPGLPGYKTITVTATSTVPGETIAGVDMIGDPAAPVNPATSRGFFGNMHQITLFGGALPTVFRDNNPVLDSQPGVNHAQDSQFLVATNATTGAVQSPSGFSRESATSLQALFSRASGFGQSFPLAQLVVNPSQAASINWRAVFAVNRGGYIVDLPEAACGGSFDCVPQPDFIQLNNLGGRDPSAGIITAKGISTLVGGGPITWSNLQPVVGTGLGVPAIPATLDAEGNFRWDPAGSKTGKSGSGNVLYQWTATVSYFAGSGTGLAFSVILVPEPATISFAGLAILGDCCFLRRRG